MLNININEQDEMEILSMFLKVLRKYELAQDLFPELQGADSGGPYFIMQGHNIKGVCTDLYMELLEKYGGDKPTTDKGNKQPVAG